MPMLNQWNNLRVMLNATVDTKDMLGQVVKRKYCAMHQVVCKFQAHK
jgi:hypothetical protein